jgi:hypothetical protein
MNNSSYKDSDDELSLEELEGITLELNEVASQLEKMDMKEIEKFREGWNSILKMNEEIKRKIGKIDGSIKTLERYKACNVTKERELDLYFQKYRQEKKNNTKYKIDEQKSEEITMFITAIYLQIYQIKSSQQN